MSNIAVRAHFPGLDIIHLMTTSEHIQIWRRCAKPVKVFGKTMRKNPTAQDRDRAVGGTILKGQFDKDAERSMLVAIQIGFPALPSG